MAPVRRLWRPKQQAPEPAPDGKLAKPQGDGEPVMSHDAGESRGPPGKGKARETQRSHETGELQFHGVPLELPMLSRPRKAREAQRSHEAGELQFHGVPLDPPGKGTAREAQRSHEPGELQSYGVPVELEGASEPWGRPAPAPARRRRRAKGARATRASTAGGAVLRDPKFQVKWGQMCNVLSESFLTEDELWGMLKLMQQTQFRWYAGRNIVDWKVQGECSLTLQPPYDFLNPLVRVAVELARRSLEPHEDLAIIQLIVNSFSGQQNEVKPHTHRCRQVCIALGAERELVVEDRRVVMKFGDCMPLRGQVHSVPKAEKHCGPRLSVCLFYGSAEEYMSSSMSVNATDGYHGWSYWWEHPQDQSVTPQRRRRPGNQPRYR